MAETEENPGKLLYSMDLIDGRSGDTVSGETLRGKVVLVAIAPHWLPMPLRQTVASVSEHTDEIQAEGKPIAFVYVPVDRDEAFIARFKTHGQPGMLDERDDKECFDDLRRQLPQGWLAVPLEKTETRAALVSGLKDGIMGVAFIDENGNTSTKNGLEILYKWGAEGYPFTDERIKELQEEFKERAAKQSLKQLLVNSQRDYLITKDGSQVKVESLEGKVVGLYFGGHWCGPCRRLMPKLVEMYNTLKSKGEDFEVVFVSADKDEAGFEDYLKEMPWLAVPYSDTKQIKLLQKWFDVDGIPMLVILGKDGKTVQTEAVKLVLKHGIEAYPFTPERLNELKAEEDKKRAAQSLESLLVTKSRDYVISPDGKEVKVSDLKGKTVGLYFSAHWCPPCRLFTPTLISVYKELKENQKEFEVIFISGDRDEESFKSYYGSMPWLALPFSDREAKSNLSSYFDVQGIPTLIIVGPDGKTITTEGRELVGHYQAQAFPFTGQHIEALQAARTAEAAKMPKEISHSSHPEHKLFLVEDAYDGRSFGCDLCDEDGTGWVYHCQECSFDIHPHCAKKEIEEQQQHKEEEPKDEEPKDEEPKDEEPTEEEPKEGWVCEGDVCKKA